MASQLTNPTPLAPALLSRAEQAVLVHMLAGGTNPEIGNALGISPRTVDVHRGSIFAKMGARSAVHLGWIAARQGFPAAEGFLHGSARGTRQRHKEKARPA